MTLSAGRISLLVSTGLFLIALVLLIIGEGKLLPITEAAGLFFLALGLFLG